MGVYFIAAGRSSQNREKTLDRQHRLEDIARLVSGPVAERLRSHFPSGDGLFLWGANDRSFEHLSRVKPEEYVVDVNMKRVVQVFRFAFFIETYDSKLQDYVGWDSEKSSSERRPYHFVYFLKSRMKTSRSEKEFFQHAFGFGNNGQWLAGQRYIDEWTIQEALERTQSSTVEILLGLAANKPLASTVEEDLRVKQMPVVAERFEFRKSQEPTDAPEQLSTLVKRIQKLRADSTALERDHEDLVAALFEKLGYERVDEIKFQRGRIDIRIDVDGVPRYTIEVKADWSLSWRNSKALPQAYNYALQQGTRYVLLTNGDTYFLFDRDNGRSYDDNFVGEFRLTDLSESGEKILNLLRK